jgi:RNA polymerase sigma-70 factor (ECF subfamily)
VAGAILRASPERNGERLRIVKSTGKTADARETAELTARRSYGKLVALLAARTGDVASAEDALAEAFASALAEWPARGCPANPDAWLLTAARRKLIDSLRRRKSGAAAAEHLKLMAEEMSAAGADNPAIPDRRLALMFACAHPAIDAAVRAPLILQAVLGLDAAAIGRAFLVSPAAMAQRLVRAKSKIRRARIPFRIPEPSEFRGRAGAVLDAIYACFVGGSMDAAETDSNRRDLADEALFLSRLVAEMMPEEPEARGLLALLLHVEARRGARRDAEGEYVPIGEQEVALWNRAMMGEAESLLRRAAAMGSIGRYQLEAALQSAHVHRRLAGTNNWKEIVRLYDGLTALTHSPVVAINRALALAEVEGAVAGIAALDDLREETRLMEYQPYWAARAELLARTGAVERAMQAYSTAIALEADPAVRRFLERRLARLRA